ncbi:MAG: RNA-binding protein [Pyrinomonadaceae bacterium]|nr:RNA-binding protein [Sphingobacteriaceae bacterium]
MNIFVASLPYQLEEADVKETFEEFGTVSSVKLILDKETGKKRGFGFVEMPDDEEAQKAITELNGLEVFGRNISVSKAEEKRESAPRPQRSFSSPDRSSGGGYKGGNGGGGYSKSSGSGGGRGGDYNKSSSRDRNKEDGNRW